MRKHKIYGEKYCNNEFSLDKLFDYFVQLKCSKVGNFICLQKYFMMIKKTRKIY